MKILNLWPLVLTLTLSACTITRYYKTKPLKSQLHKLSIQVNQDLGKIQADHQLKQKSVAQLGPEGQKLKPVMQKLTATLTKAEAEVAAANDDIQRMQTVIGNKSKITSNDAGFKDLQDYEQHSKLQLAKLNETFASYATTSNEFSQQAQQMGIFTVDTQAYQQSLTEVTAALEAQCNGLEKKINEADKSLHDQKTAQNEKRHQLLVGMRQDITGLRAVRDELRQFQISFTLASKGKDSYLVTPSHPQHALFKSLKSIQEKAQTLVASFNDKVAAFNK